MAGAVLASDRVLVQQWAGEQGTRIQASAVGDTFGFKAIALAKEDAALSFPMPVEIAEILVRSGQRVARGDLLVRARDDEVRLQRDLQRLSAETNLPVERAFAAMEQARVEWEGQDEVRRRSKATHVPYAVIELERARTTYLLREAEHKLAQLEKEQQLKQLDFRQAQLDRMRIVAPFDGIIDRIACHIGEVRRESEPVIRIVATDVLKIDAQPPAHLTLDLNLKPGDPAWVLMDLPGEPRVYMGTVMEVAPTVDSASRTRTVRVELDNRHGWPAGLNAWVRFTEPSAEWLARIEHPPARETADARPVAPKPAGAPE